MKRTITFPEELDSQILYMSKAQDRSFSNYVIHAVRSEIKKQMSKYMINAAKLKSGAGNCESGEK